MDFDKEIENQRLEKDPQEQMVYMICDNCGAEIYEGQEFYDCDAGYLCEDCFDEIQKIEKFESERIAGEKDEWQ